MAVAALRSGVPENVKAPGVILRQMLTWMLSTARAAAGDRARRGGRQGFAAPRPHRRACSIPILLLALAALGIGFVSTLLVAMSIADPLRQLRWALSRGAAR